MKDTGHQEELLRAVREAIDPAAIGEALEATYGEEFDEAVALALREAAAEEIAVATADAADRARRRAREPIPEDVAEAVERRRHCGCEAPPMYPTFGVWESK